MAIGAAQGYLPPEHYNQIFSAHGTIMIFFVAMPFVIGFMNFVVPLQLGAGRCLSDDEQRQLLADGLGRPADQHQPIPRRVRPDGLAGIPPLSEKEFSPGVGVDYYLVALQISGVGPS